MKVHIFTIRLIQLNHYLPYFLPDCVGQMVKPLPDEVKEILYYIMLNIWMKRKIKQGHNDLDRSIQAMSGFFETRVENLEVSAPKPTVNMRPRKKKKGNLKKQKVIT